jgi:hypothetical protein
MGKGISNVPRPRPDTTRISTSTVDGRFEWICPRIAHNAERIIARASMADVSRFMTVSNSF